MSTISNERMDGGWKKEGSGATFCSGDWRVNTECEPNHNLTVSHSHQILTRLSISPKLGNHADSANQAASIEGSLPLGESYVRQNDFVAIFPEQPPLTFGYQVYTCIKPPAGDLPAGDILVLELWLSVQTSTLESHPQLHLKWGVDGEGTESCVLVETESGIYLSEDRKRGLIIHPLDVADCSLTNSHGNPELLAFGRFMEKGVIRRMRLQLIHSQQSMGADQWQLLVDSFSRSPLPLTA
ncbi:hypothetical protein SH449x_003072 [Pirellulaceae bacterium SH449]